MGGGEETFLRKKFIAYKREKEPLVCFSDNTW
jgi:hypothetical protein